MKKALSDFLFLIGALFVATWPGILTNWLSDLLGRWLNIETSAGTWTVIAAVIASIIMQWIFRRRTDPNGPYNTPQASDKNAKYYLMHGGMVTLAIVLNQICQGMYSGTPTEDKIIPAILALIPALEGIFGSQFIHIENNQAIFYLDRAIRELVFNNPRISERMILEHAKGLGEKERVTPFTGLSAAEINKLIRSRMVHMATTGELDVYFGKNQRISIDSFHDPNQWRLEKKDVTPVKQSIKPAPRPMHPVPDPQVEARKAENYQRTLWEKWQADIDDEVALRALLEQAYHTPNGLSVPIKAEIMEMLNQILLSVIEEEREMTSLEEARVMVLKLILGKKEP